MWKREGGWLGKECGRFYEKNWGQALRKGTGCFSGKTVWGERVCAHWQMCVWEPGFVCCVYFICLFVLQKEWQFVHQHVSLLTSCKIWIPVHVCETHKKGEKANRRTSCQKKRGEVNSFDWKLKKYEWTKLIKLQDIRAHSAPDLSTSWSEQIRQLFVFY